MRRAMHKPGYVELMAAALAEAGWARRERTQGAHNARVTTVVRNPAAGARP